MRKFFDHQLFVVSMIFVMCLQVHASADIPSAAQFAQSIEGEFPDGMVGKAYNDEHNVTSHFHHSRWEVVGGKLPPGLELNKYGYFSGAKAELKGTPSKSGAYTFTLLVRYHDNSTLTKTFNVTILDNPNLRHPVIVGSFASGMVNKPYSSSIYVADGKAPYKWIYDADLPQGLKFKEEKPDKLTLSGIPREKGKFTVIVSAEDRFSEAGPQAFTVIIR